MNDNIQVIERAFAILESVVANNGKAQQLNDLVLNTELNSSTVARIAQTLVNCGYLEQLGRRKGYVIGKKVYSLTSETDFHHNLIVFAKPLLEDFAKKNGEYICLSVMFNGKRIILKYILPESKVQINSKIIEQETPYRSMSGRAMLAEYSELEQRTFFKTNGLSSKCWPEVESEDDFVAELKKIKAVSICIRINHDLASFGIPVNIAGKCKVALGVFMPVYRYNKKIKTSLIKDIKDIAYQIEKNFQSN